MRFKTPTIRLHDTTLYVREAGDGPVAIFVHGFPLDGSMWLDQVAALASERRCLVPDLRGFGRSAPTAKASLTMEQHAEDIAALLDIEDVDKADIIGLSMGGYVALALAERYPDRVRSLVLVDTRAGGDSEEGRAKRDAAAEKVVAEGRSAFHDGLAGALLAPNASLTARARLRTMIEATPVETIVAALNGMKVRADRTELLARIQVPTAVIVGELDELTPPSEAEAMVSALPKGELFVIPEAGHLAPMEAPQAVSDVLAKWFRR